MSPDRKPTDALDHLPVALFRDGPDARCEAAVDVEVEARDARVAPRSRPLAGPKAEDAIEDVERLAHLLRVRVRPEVDGARAMPLAREHDPRVLVRQRHRDVRERFVVAEPDVERRPVALDEVLLEVQRLGLVPRDDHLDVRDERHQLRRPGASVAALEVAADARAERLRLADVDHASPLVAEQVDARSSGQRFEGLFNAFLQSAASVAPCERATGGRSLRCRRWSEHSSPSSRRPRAPGSWSEPWRTTSGRPRSSKRRRR